MSLPRVLLASGSSFLALPAEWGRRSGDGGVTSEWKLALEVGLAGAGPGAKSVDDDERDADSGVGVVGLVLSLALEDRSPHRTDSGCAMPESVLELELDGERCCCGARWGAPVAGPPVAAAGDDIVRSSGTFGVGGWTCTSRGGSARG